MKRFLYLPLIFLLFSACSLFEDDTVPKLDSAEFYETGDPFWPVIAVDETATVFGFNQTLEQIYVQLPEGDEWVVKLDQNGRPTTMFVHKNDVDFLLVFSDFEGNRGNVAVINQETLETEYFYDIKFEGFSDISDLKSQVKTHGPADRDLKSGFSGPESSDIISWWDTYGEAVKKTVGPVIGGIGCGVPAITAVGSGGMATPIAVLSCGSFASSITGDIVGESSDAGGVLFKGGSMVGKYGEMILKCSSANWGQCALGIAGGIGATANLFIYGTSRSDVDGAQEQMRNYMLTGGLAGTWVGEEENYQGTTSQAEYYFGLNAGVLTLTTSTTVENTTSSVQMKFQFNYSVEDNNRLTISYFRITIHSASTAGGETYTQDLGPYTWNEFVNLGDYNPGNIPETSTVTFKIENNGKELTLDGRKFYRE